MNKLNYNSRGELIFAGHSLLDLAKKNKTPFYVYDLKGMLGQINQLKNAFMTPTHIHYAMKANSNPTLLKAFSKQKIGVDTVSIGEIKRALECNFKPTDILFSGVGKTEDELIFAIKKKIKQINVESPEELIRIGNLSKKLKIKTPLAIRLNPDVNPNTHPYITTGFRENKFGMDFSFLPEIKSILKKYSNSVFLQGVTLHIGSQLLDLEALEESLVKTIPLFNSLRAEGYPLKFFDVGGGLGISYKDYEIPPRITDYANLIDRHFSKTDIQVQIEPGRLIVGSFGVLVGQIQYIKTTEYKKFAIMNTGMNHLLRPALYGAYHKIAPIKFNKNTQNSSNLYDVVGPICESSDVIGKDRLLPKLRSNDYLAILDTGAYGFVMSSHYNLSLPPKELVLK